MGGGGGRGEGGGGEEEGGEEGWEEGRRGGGVRKDEVEVCTEQMRYRHAPKRYRHTTSLREGCNGQRVGSSHSNNQMPGCSEHPGICRSSKLSQ